VEERLRLAGYTGKGLFRRGALKRVHEVTKGVPRLINIVCDGALLAGYSRDLAWLDERIIDEAARDLGLTGAPARPDAEAAAPAAAPAQRWRSRLRGMFR